MFYLVFRREDFYGHLVCFEFNQKNIEINQKMIEFNQKNMEINQKIIEFNRKLMNLIANN